MREIGREIKTESLGVCERVCVCMREIGREIKTESLGVCERVCVCVCV